MYRFFVHMLLWLFIGWLTVKAGVFHGSDSGTFRTWFMGIMPLGTSIISAIDGNREGE